MKRFVIVASVLLLAFLGMTYVSLVVVPPWAKQILEEGRELPLSHQVLIASGHFWARYWVVLAAALAVVLAALMRNALVSREPRQGPGPLS